MLIRRLKGSSFGKTIFCYVLFTTNYISSYFWWANRIFRYFICSKCENQPCEISLSSEVIPIKYFSFLHVENHSNVYLGDKQKLSIKSVIHTIVMNIPSQWVTFSCLLRNSFYKKQTKYITYCSIRDGYLWNLTNFDRMWY